MSQSKGSQPAYQNVNSAASALAADAATSHRSRHHLLMTAAVAMGADGAQLPTGETVAVEFMPPNTGEFEFACQMGTLRGKLIVE